MKKIKVKDEVNLFRDMSTNAIINTDVQAYTNYINSRKLKESESQKIKNIENEISDMKNDLNEIKNLLRNLANGS